MKTVTLEEFRAHVDRYLAEAEQEDVVLTRNDKPYVVLQPVSSKAGETDDLVRSPEFWRMIQERRNEMAIPWAEAKKQLEIE